MENIITRYNSNLQNFALFALRIIIAVVFLYAGSAKWIFWTTHPAEMSDSMLNLIKFLSIVEPLGALALIIGLLTRLTATGLALIMVGAILILNFTMQTKFFTSPTAIGWDYNLILLGGCLILAAFGAGKWSVDGVRKLA